MLRVSPGGIMVALERVGPPGFLGGLGRRRVDAQIRGPSHWTDQGIKRQADHRANRQRRRDRRKAWVEVGAGLLDRRSLRYGLHLRSPRRRSHKRPPAGDRLFGQRANHHAASVRRGRDVGDPPEARLIWFIYVPAGGFWAGAPSLPRTPPNFGEHLLSCTWVNKGLMRGFSPVNRG
jgi:hypothetical protein